MCTVGIEEATAVCTPLLDEFLGREWSLSDNLIGDNLSFLYGRSVCISNYIAGGVLLVDLNRLWINHFRRVVGLEVLNRSLRHQDQRANYAEGQQNPEQRPGHVHPEIANGFH